MTRAELDSLIDTTFEIVDRALGFDPGTVDPDWELTGSPLHLDTDGIFDLRDDINARLRAAGLRQTVTTTEMNKAKTVADVYRAALS